MPSLLARIKYFRILIDCAAKLYISSVPLINKSKNIIEIDQILCAFEENEVGKWKQQLSDANKIAHDYEKKPTNNKLKTEFNEKVTSLYESMKKKLTEAVGNESTEEFLSTAGKHFTVIKDLESCQSNEFIDLENNLNQRVQKQFDKIKNLWAKEKLQILCFSYTVLHELNSYEDFHNGPEFSGFFKYLTGYSYKKENPLTNHLDQLRSNLLDLRTKVLSWPSLFELMETFRKYYTNLIDAHSNLNNFMNQDNPLYRVSEKIFKNATELLSSWNKSPLMMDKCTAQDVLELTKERLTQIMNDINQIESLLRSAVAYHNDVKKPQSITESQAQAETFVPLLPEKSSCVYEMEGSDVTVECLSNNDWNKFFVMGDIHGEIDTFQNSEVFSANRQLLPCVVNGDFIDRGLYSIETAIFLFLLQQLFPNYFIILRGNHEEDFIAGTKREFNQQIQGSSMEIPLAELTVSLPILQNIINQSGTQIQKFEDLFKELFALLPTAAVNLKFLIIHGGLILPCEPCAGDFFKNTREFMLSAIYNPERDTEGISTLDEITGSGRPIFNDNTTCGIQKMGLTALLGHQHRNVDHPWGREVNTNFDTNILESPRVLLCSCSDQTVETHIITRKVLFPEIAKLQLYFCSLPKETRSRIFATLLCDQLSNVKKEHETTLMRLIVLYLYACICDNESKALLDNPKEINNFFETITKHEATAHQTSVEQYKQELMFRYGYKGAEHFMRKVLQQCGKNTSDNSFIKAQETFNLVVKNAQTELDNIAKQNDANFLELLSQRPPCLVNFFKKELEILIDTNVNLTAEILSKGEKKKENLEKMDTALKNLLNFFEHITRCYETLEMANAKKSLSHYLQEKITNLNNIEIKLQKPLEELETPRASEESTQQSTSFSP